jgi:hypothetical protein
MISTKSVKRSSRCRNWREPDSDIHYWDQPFFTSGVHTFNFADRFDPVCHERRVTLVSQMLDLNKRLQDAKLEHEKTLLSRQVEAADGAIDALVYELYGLTGEEITIVEGTGK